MKKKEKEREKKRETSREILQWWDYIIMHHLIFFFLKFKFWLLMYICFERNNPINIHSKLLSKAPLMLTTTEMFSFSHPHMTAQRVVSYFYFIVKSIDMW